MKQRVLTAFALIPPVLAALFAASIWPIWVLAFAALLVGYSELRKFADSAWRIPILGLAPILAAAPVIPGEGGDLPLFHFFLGPFDVAFWLTVLSALGVFACLYITMGAKGFLSLEFASLWLSAPLASLVLIKMQDPVGGIIHWSSPILLAFVPLWVGDTLAYFVGKKWGRKLLAPRISPKKTWAGALANFAGCFFAAVPLALMLDLPAACGILVGIVTGLLGQGGDLLESAMKRSADLKDSGSLLPGHGGLLDRIDSILLSAPLVCMIVVAYIAAGR